MDTPRVDPKDAYNTAVAAVLSDRRKELRMTIDELTEKTELSRATVLRLLAGQRDIRMGYFIALVRALDVEPSQVITEASARIPAVVGD